MEKSRELKLDFGDDFLLDSAEDRFNEGDYLGALTILNKREARNAPLADAYAIYADVYEALELWELAADAWYRFLDTCNEADFPEGYEGLAVCYMNLGNDFRSGFFFRRAYDEDIFLPEGDPPPELHLVRSDGVDLPQHHPEVLAAGLSLLKEGNLDLAREKFASIPEESEDYASGMGLAAMCTLMSGDEEGAQRECEALIGDYPDNVQVLTTYCAVLGAREKRPEAKNVAEKLAMLPVTATDDLYRIATALCETGLHGAAYEKLRILRERIPYDENVLWFFAVAACYLGRPEEAIEALELLTTVYPRKAVAHFWLEKLRRARDAGEKVYMSYFYRLPEADYRRIASYLLSGAEDEDKIADPDEFQEAFRLAFDEMEGRDIKLQLFAAKIAVRCRQDELLRSFLLDHNGEEGVKFSILHDLTLRNEENSFGVVICGFYKEILYYALDIGTRDQTTFLHAFADVYIKNILVADDCETRICAAAEDIFATLCEAGERKLLTEREALAAAIYREARIPQGEHDFSKICKEYEAEERKVRMILDLMM